jgi:glycosyltransferase involved in cell wall biosynthesis
MPPLRLAVDARVIAEDTRGIGRYARAVLRRLAGRDDVALTLLADGPFPQRRRSAYARALSSRAGDNLEVLWHPANGTFFASPLPSVATIHDAVPFRYPDPDPKRREHAQQIPAEKIEVIPHGLDPSFTPGPPEPLPAVLRTRRFLLFVGDPIAEPRKNFPLLYEAYRRAWPSGEAPALAIAGPRAPELPGVIHAGNLVDDLVAAGSATLRACYRGALALALASYHETFGMPMLEAMACGTPVVASHASSLPEIGGEAAFYAPPDNADAWASALRRVVEDADLRERLRAAGLEHVKQFDWDVSAQRHLAVFRAVAG